jgi:hypothetical protein
MTPTEVDHDNPRGKHCSSNRRKQASANNGGLGKKSGRRRRRLSLHEKMRGAKIEYLVLPKEYKDNKGSAISCLYYIAGRTGGGQ